MRITLFSSLRYWQNVAIQWIVVCSFTLWLWCRRWCAGRWALWQSGCRSRWCETVDAVLQQRWPCLWRFLRSISRSLTAVHCRGDHISRCWAVLEGWWSLAANTLLTFLFVTEKCWGLHDWLPPEMLFLVVVNFGSSSLLHSFRNSPSPWSFMSRTIRSTARNTWAPTSCFDQVVDIDHSFHCKCGMLMFISQALTFSKCQLINLLVARVTFGCFCISRRDQV